MGRNKKLGIERKKRGKVRGVIRLLEVRRDIESSGCGEEGYFVKCFWR